jgi:hypothetical protein
MGEIADTRLAGVLNNFAASRMFCDIFMNFRGDSGESARQFEPFYYA